MSNQVTCPSCGAVFTIDEANYAAIVSQIKSKEFEMEVNHRMAELKRQSEAEQKVAAAQTANAYYKKLSEKELEITNLKSQLEGISRQKQNEMQLALAEKDRRITELEAATRNSATERALAVTEVQKDAQNKLNEKKLELEQLKLEEENRRNEQRNEYEKKVSELNEELERVKNFRYGRSTKMVGEELERYCHDEFDAVRGIMYPNAYFEKDNDASQGSKGDFIFRDYADAERQEPYISIMFEMKNEVDTTATKHKNADFFAKLDEDRRKKGCEYAVLVSTLEPDSNLYNKGIVDVSHRYRDMFVVRPNFFMSIIAMLTKTSRKSVDLQRQLVEVKQREIDVNNFEATLDKLKKDFGINVERYRKHFQNTIKAIDASIAQLNKIREELTGCDNNLRIADGKIQGITVRKLTNGNPTMKAKFDEARKNASPNKNDEQEPFDNYEEVEG